MRGRRPKPTNLKKLTGNPGKRRLREDEPVATGTAECPEHLDAIARREWERVAPLLQEMGILASIDAAALAGYCANYSLWVNAQRESGKLVRKTERGMAVNPYVRIAQAAMDQMRKFMAEFGMTPSSRSRLAGSVTRKKEENTFAEIAAEARAVQ